MTSRAPDSGSRSAPAPAAAHAQQDGPAPGLDALEALELECRRAHRTRSVPGRAAACLRLRRRRPTPHAEPQHEQARADRGEQADPRAGEREAVAVERDRLGAVGGDDLHDRGADAGAANLARRAVGGAASPLPTAPATPERFAGASGLLPAAVEGAVAIRRRRARRGPRRRAWELGGRRRGGGGRSGRRPAAAAAEAAARRCRTAPPRDSRRRPWRRPRAPRSCASSAGRRRARAWCWYGSWRSP